MKISLSTHLKEFKNRKMLQFYKEIIWRLPPAKSPSSSQTIEVSKYYHAFSFPSKTRGKKEKCTALVSKCDPNASLVEKNVIEMVEIAVEMGINDMMLGY